MHLASWSLKLSGTWVLGCLFALILLTELDEDQFYLAHLWTAFQSCLLKNSTKALPIFHSPAGLVLIRMNLV